MLSCLYLFRSNKLLKLLGYLPIDWFRGAGIYPYFFNNFTHIYEKV